MNYRLWTIGCHWPDVFDGNAFHEANLVDERFHQRLVGKAHREFVDGATATTLEDLDAHHVGPDRTDEEGRASEPRGGDRLVRALPPVVALEVPAGHRLAGDGKVPGADDQVDVDRPDDDDAAAHRASR